MGILYYKIKERDFVVLRFLFVFTHSKKGELVTGGRLRITEASSRAWEEMVGYR